MPEDFGAQYRAAKQAVKDHLSAWADTERAKQQWLKEHRGVPAHLLYDRATGAPLDPDLAALEAAEDKAQQDYEWCKALVIACGELVKGRPFEEILAEQQTPSEEVD